MSEEMKFPAGSRPLTGEELEQVTGGVLTDEELNAYLDNYSDPALRRAWEVAIGILVNYKGWDYNRYAGIADDLAKWCIDYGHLQISQPEFKRIMLQAYQKFFWKIHS